MAESWTPKDDYSPSNHNHDTKYSPLGHNHDERYYTEAEVDAKLKTLKNEILAAGIDMLPVGTIMWFKQSVTLSNKWQVYQPLIGRYPLGATSGLGSTVEAGLPNITGFTGYGVGDTTYAIDTSGAFIKGGKVGTYTLTGQYTLPNTWDVINFDASESSEVYGKSNTVTPPSAKLIPYVKIA